MRYVVIAKYTPDNFRDVTKRMMSVATGEAPKPVLEAHKKFNYIAQESAIGSCYTFQIVETDDQKAMATVAAYFADLLNFEIYPTLSMEEAMKLRVWR